MKKIFYFLSIALVLFFSCNSEESNQEQSMHSDVRSNEEISNHIVSISEHIQSSNEEHLNINDLRPYLKKLVEEKVLITDSSSFIVELKIPFDKTTDALIKEKISNKFTKPLTSNELTTWYLHTKSGKELEISMVDKEPEITLRFLLRTYL